MPAPTASPSPVRRPRAEDVARAAGVSPATVDRVLHRRPGVRDATVHRVFKAAAALGYLPEADLAAAVAAPPRRIAFVLPRGSRFPHLLGDMVGWGHEHWAPYHVRCRTEFVDAIDPWTTARTLLLQGTRHDGLVTFAPDHPVVREVVDALAVRGVPVATLISDLPGSRRAAYVGLDNHAAGRTAGDLIGRFLGPRRARVALVAGSRAYAAHGEREAGFRAVLAERHPRLEVVGLHEGGDDPARTARLTRALLQQHPDLAAIYNLGGAADGVARALAEAGRAQAVVVVGHGLTPDTRARLLDGTLDAVITQSPLATLMNCVRVFANLRDGRPVLSGVEAPRSQVIFRENLP